MLFEKYYVSVDYFVVFIFWLWKIFIWQIVWFNFFNISE